MFSWFSSLLGASAPTVEKDEIVEVPPFASSAKTKHNFAAPQTTPLETEIASDSEDEYWGALPGGGMASTGRETRDQRIERMNTHMEAVCWKVGLRM